MQVEELKSRLREKRDVMNESHATRLHRAVSWLQCAEKYDDDDIGFMTAWISFNACYSIKDETEDLSERTSFGQFIHQLTSLDTNKQIHDCIWHNYSSFVRAVINNKFIFNPFWRSLRTDDNHWESSFEGSKKRAMHALANSDVPVLMEIILDRLYVLRNQLMHGGATYQSRVNRDQVKDGKRMLMELMPIIINIMLEQHDKDWGEIFYPVVKD